MGGFFFLVDDRLTTMCTDWILEENIKPLLETVAGFAGTKLDKWDWDAITLGLKSTHHEDDQWFDYQFKGDHSVNIRLAREPGTSVLFVEVESNPQIESQCAVALSIMGEYRLQ